MQTNGRVATTIRTVLVMTLLFAGFAHAQSMPAPSISIHNNGDYSVSYQACVSCFGHGLQVWMPQSNGWEYAGSGELSVSNPIPGIHRYRVIYVLYTGPVSYQPVYGPEASVVIDQNMQAELSERPSLSVQMNADYAVSSGDIDGNGSQDLYIRRSSPMPGSANGTIGDVLLVQSSQGVFEPSIPDQQQLAIASSWLPVQIQVGKRDVNIDGYLDLILRGFDRVSGFSNASNQILFAPGETGRDQPPAARAVDAGLIQFSEDMDRHLVDPDYYLTHVPTSYALIVYYALNCNWAGYGYATVFDTGVPWSCYREPQYVYVVYRNYSVFDRDAMEIASIDYRMIHDFESTDTGLDRIADRIGTMLGVSIGGWDINELLGQESAVTEDDDQLAMGLFAVLAAISEAVAQAVEEESANGPDERVELRGRRVLGQGPFHTALQFQQSTVSAFDSDPRPLWDGDLVSQVNWPRDHPSLTLRMGFVDGPTIPLLYWNTILVMDRRYDDDLPYDLFPSLGQGGYNSNSYISGLVKATLGMPTIQVESFVGGERPVPASAFN